ncbi:MAG: hypothetical protein P8046_12180, partial [Anaerolineales bacterium]
EHCQRLGFILNGQIIAYGSPGEIKSNTFSTPVLELAPENPTDAMRSIQQAVAAKALLADDVELYGAFVHVFSRDPKIEKKVKKYMQKNGIPVKHYMMIEPSLEDVFIASVRNNGKTAQSKEKSKGS